MYFSQDAKDTKETKLPNKVLEDCVVCPVSTIPPDGDIAAQYAEEGEIQLSPEMNNRLRRKADMFIMPIISLVYGLQFADKVIPSSAAMLGLTDELFSTSKTGYSWVGSSFYLGYLIFEFPMSYLMQKMNLTLFCGMITVMWGTLLACTAACQNMESFIACRVLLGMLECGIQPAFTVIVTQWYQRQETLSRTSLWYCCNGLGGLFVLSISYGFKLHSEKTPDVYHMTPWRMIYIIMGLITIVMGIILWLTLPATPQNARFLNTEEKRYQVERIRHNSQGFGSHHIKLYQIKEAILDIRTWLYGISYLLGTIANGGLTVFSTLIFSGMGYKGKDSLLMNMPSYAIECGGMFLIAVVSSRFLTRIRLIYILGGSIISFISLALLAWAPTVKPQLAGLFLYSWSSVVTSAGFISMIESDAAGTTKKVTTNAIFLVCYCAGNMIGPQVFYTSEAPQYPTGKRTMAAAQAVQLVLICILGIYNFMENKYRDRKGITQPPEDFVNAEFADLTDKQMPWFRYSL